MKYLLSFLFMLGMSAALAQQQQIKAPVIGEALPDFTFHVKYQEAGTKKLSDLRGKPVLLFFFAKGCVGSFHALPKIQELYTQYKTRVHFIGVAADHRDRIAESYERYRKHYRFTLPVAIDSVVYRAIGLHSFPTIILLDEGGVIRAITYAISPESMDHFLEGKPFFFHNTSQAAKLQKYKEFDPRKPLFVNNNGGSGDEFLYRSLISKWQPGMPRTTFDPGPEGDIPFEKVTFLNAVGRSLAELYRIAYFGRSIAWDVQDSVAYGNYHFNVMLEVRDSSLFNYDLDAGKNMFNYSQVIQPHLRTKENMLRVMQGDLKNCFGYEVTVENRKMPYLRLIAKPGAINKLKTTGGKTTGKGDQIDGLVFHNHEIKNLLIMINSAIHLSSADLPLLDETGITGNVDITIRGVMTSLEDVTRALRTQGLDIVKGEREMKVIVIRDAPGQLK